MCTTFLQVHTVDGVTKVSPRSFAYTETVEHQHKDNTGKMVTDMVTKFVSLDAPKGAK
jgi:hypothetical protein